MEAPATASWDQNISEADFSKLKAGFEALVMNHRWKIKIDSPDENGIISIHMSRSWTEIDQYIFAVKPSTNNKGGGGKIISDRPPGFPRNQPFLIDRSLRLRKNLFFLSGVIIKQLFFMFTKLIISQKKNQKKYL
jgi:hypothetical protein